MKKVYLAGPFFDPEQKKTMKWAKGILELSGFKVIDPQELSPVIVDLPPEQRTKTLFSEIFANNVNGIRECDLLVASIDWKDTGTSFELGYAAALGKPAITFTASGKKANVMLAEATAGHCDILALAACARDVVNGKAWAKAESNE